MPPRFSPRIVALFLAAATLVALVVAGISMHNALMPLRVDVHARMATPADELLWALDRAVHHNGKLLLEGWVVKRREHPRTLNTAFLLSAPDGSFYQLPSQPRLRKDVTALLIQDKTNYDHSGLRAYSPTALFSNTPYTVYILYEGNGHQILIPTGFQL